MLQAVIEKELQYTLLPPNIVPENVGCMALTINSYAKIATALSEPVRDTILFNFVPAERTCLCLAVESCRQGGIGSVTRISVLTSLTGCALVIDSRALSQNLLRRRSARLCQVGGRLTYHIMSYSHIVLARLGVYHLPFDIGYCVSTLYV
jgi:hypothetical protein